jgi:hypothetical protein
MQLRDRIIRLVRVKASSVRPHPANWRTHPQAQIDALSETLSSLGFAGAILARELVPGDDTQLQALDGHARLSTLGDAVVPVLVTDLTEEEGLRLLATFDPLSALASTDATKLDALLAGLKDLPPALDSFLAVQAEGAKVAELLAAAEGTGEGPRLSTEPAAVVKVVLPCTDTGLFERALAATGEVNRGAALKLICEAYLRGEARQQDVRAEGAPPAEPPPRR